MDSGLADERVGHSNAPFGEEEIPDNDLLYMRVHRTYWTNPDPNYIPASCFKDLPNPGAGMSTDWCRYAKPHETRAREGQPEMNAVVSMRVEDIKRIEAQGVVHDPLIGNRAHSLVKGPKTKPRIRKMFSRCARIQIRIDDPVAG